MSYESIWTANDFKYNYTFRLSSDPNLLPNTY